MNPTGMKIFGIGMFRTGTTTLGVCLKKFGFRHHGFWHVTDFSPEGLDHRLTEAMPEIIQRAQGFDAFEDAPWLFLYRELDREFPGSKFILTHRTNSDKLAESERKWHRINGESEQSMPSREFFIERYETHNHDARAYFADRSEDFLEICWENGDGWEKLCDFLGVEPPKDRRGNTIPLPHVNASRPWRRAVMKLKKIIRKFIGT